MNSCIFMVELLRDPELRYTTDQLPIVELSVQLPGIRPEDPPATVKAVGFGDLAADIQQQYRQGDRVILEGRLSMETTERPEGFREKHAEIRIGRIVRVADLSTASLGVAAAPSSAPAPRSAPAPVPTRPAPAPVATLPNDEPEYDDIPF